MMNPRCYICNRVQLHGRMYPDNSHAPLGKLRLAGEATNHGSSEVVGRDLIAAHCNYNAKSVGTGSFLLSGAPEDQLKRNQATLT